MEERGLLDRVLDRASPPRCQCSGPHSSRWLGGVGGFLADPIPILFPESAPSSLLRGGSMDSIWKF